MHSIHSFQTGERSAGKTSGKDKLLQRPMQAFAARKRAEQRRKVVPKGRNISSSATSSSNALLTEPSMMSPGMKGSPILVRRARRIGFNRTSGQVRHNKKAGSLLRGARLP